jgi:beta-xylosidase
MLRVVAPGPVYDGDVPDPFVLVDGDRYFAYCTQTGDTNVQVMQSGDLARWDHRGDALPELPSWAGWGKTWSPAVLRRGEAYVLFYAVLFEAAGRQCISVATASGPTGPFVDRSKEPFIFQEDRAGSIDPSPFVDGDGTAYLLWKSDDNAIDQAPSLWGAPLQSDGLGLSGEPVELLRHDAPWEAPLVEAPSLARVADGTYVLFYSGGWWEDESYAIGYATGPAPLGPFRKETESGPWLASSPGRAGPGGAEVFTDSDGRWRMAMHAWTPPDVGYENGGARSLWIESFDFADGRPVLG